MSSSRAQTPSDRPPDGRGERNALRSSHPPGAGFEEESREARKHSGTSRRKVGPYVIESRLAAGGMAEVFIAQRHGLHGFSKRVALKRILPQYGSDPDFQAMFVDEAHIASSLSHPNIVQVFDFGELDGDLFLAMELVEGSNVNAVLRAASALKTEVPLDVALYIAGETARALAYAHAASDEQGRSLGVVHRDVSPANVLLTKTGHVKLTDFGIATAAIRSRHTETGHVRGKLGYMSPAQVLGRDVDGRSDVFTLATVLAELLIQRPLFGTGPDLDILVRIRDVDLSALHRTGRPLPRDVLNLLENTLVRSRDERPSAAAFADACAEIRRRRGMGHGPEQLSEFLRQLELIRSDTAPIVRDERLLDSGAGRRPSSRGARRPPSAPEMLAMRSVAAARPTGPARSPSDVMPNLARPGAFVEDAPDALDFVPAEIYRVRVGAQVEGPMSFARIVQRFVVGEIDPAAQISCEGGPFVRVAESEELARFVASPGLQWQLDELLRAERRGPLGTGALVPVVFELMLERATGVLHLWQDHRRKKIYFVDGRPDFVASTDPGELLGEHLIASGRLLRMELDMALAMLPRFEGRLGDALVGLGLLRPVELYHAVTTQVRERVLEAFAWRSGEWAWVPGPRSGEDSFPLPDAGFVLLRDAIQRIHPEELEALLSPNWERLVYRRGAPEVALARFELPSSWSRVLDRFEGGATIAAHLARQAARGADGLIDAYRALYLAVACRQIRFDTPDDA